MECQVFREDSDHVNRVTLGEWRIDGQFFCYTLEDIVREIPGVPVAQWKIMHETAIPRGRYRLSLVASPKFGPDSILVNDVPGYTGILVHSGLNEDHTSGCILVGDRIDRTTGTISGGKNRGVLLELKRRIKRALTQGEAVWLTIDDFPKEVHA